MYYTWYMRGSGREKHLLWAAYRKHVNFHQEVNYKEHQVGKTCTYRGYSHTADKPRMWLKNRPVIALTQWRPPCLFFSTLSQADQKFQTRIQGKDGNGEGEWIRSHNTLKHCGSSVQPVYLTLPGFSNRNYLINASWGLHHIRFNRTKKSSFCARTSR